MAIEILNEQEKPGWLNYPKMYLDLVVSDFDDIFPWYFMDKDQISIRYQGLKKRYPDRQLFPFARDDASDDVACWEKDKPGSIVLIHDFSSPGYENKMQFNSFEDWYNFILNKLK